MFFSPRFSTCETYFRYTVKLSTQTSLIWFPLLSCWERQPRHSHSEMLRPRYFRILTVNFHFSHLYYFTCPWIQLFICSVALETPWHPLMVCVSPSTAQSISPQTDCLKMRALTFDGWLLPPVWQFWETRDHAAHCLSVSFSSSSSNSLDLWKSTMTCAIKSLW